MLNKKRLLNRRIEHYEQKNSKRVIFKFSHKKDVVCYALLKEQHWTRLRSILLELNIYDTGNIRQTVEGVLYRMRVGYPWRDLPSLFLIIIVII